MNLPNVAVSLDGRRAIAVSRLDLERHAIQNRDGFYITPVVQLRPRAEASFAKVEVSNPLRAFWDNPGQTLGWDLSFAEALPHLAFVAMGQFLDAHEVPPQPEPSYYGITAVLSSDVFSLFQREAASDAEVERFVEAKIYWSWKFKLSEARFEESDAVRLGVEISDLDHAAFPHIGTLWRKLADHRFMAEPPLIQRFERILQTEGSPTSTPHSVQYDVALSFAGEQREYVGEVAEVLRQGGAAVFYDLFEDLWGADLPVRLEEVYRKQSRFVVIFVSKEYVTKAWPNHERQHALAGRIERMDQSVLPARFDPVDLPGLPTTVGYLDIRNMSPADLAQRILRKLGMA